MSKALSVFLLAVCSVTAFGQTVRITQKPEGLVHGDLYVSVSTSDPVTHVTLFINEAKWADAAGRSVTIPVHIGEYLRRLRFRVVGYDTQGKPAGEDEMVINDPRPPFRVHLQAPANIPASGPLTLSANVIHPGATIVQAVDFFLGEKRLVTLHAPPFLIELDSAPYQHAVYARVVAHGSDGSEINDVAFFGTGPNDRVDVTLQHIPLSVAAGNKQLTLESLALTDDGKPRKIEQLIPAGAEPLYVILLIDYSESMLEELPVVKTAAKSFARALLRPQDRIAVVGFNQRVFWLTGFTNNWDAAAASVDRIRPEGETHLYDTAIEMLYDLQKQPGRHALVILTDGVDQGSKFKLEHLVHYARYAGVPVYPIIKNHVLSRLMHFGIGQLEARRLSSIARDTGATYFIIQKESELPGVYAKVAAELLQQYQLVFFSDASAQDAWHPLALHSSGGQLLRIPNGYFP